MNQLLSRGPEVRASWAPYSKDMRRRKREEVLEFLHSSRSPFIACLGTKGGGAEARPGANPPRRNSAEPFDRPRNERAGEHGCSGQSLCSKWSGARTKSLSNQRKKALRPICSCGRHRAVSITSSIQREPCHKWISRLISRLQIHQRPRFLRIGLPMRVIRRQRKYSSKPSPSDYMGRLPDKNRIAVYLTDLLEHDGQVFIRYTIRNQTKKAYVPGAPQAATLTAPHYRQSLYPLSNYQLSPTESARLKSSGETSIEVSNSEIPSPRIEPGQEKTGIVVLKLPQEHKEPIVLHLTFLAGPKGPVSATLVL